MRNWKEEATGRTLRGRIDGKKDDGTEVRILLENSKAVWIPVAKLSKEDQEFVSKWEIVNVKLEAKTVAMSTDRGQWGAVWTAESKDSAAILAAAGSDLIRGRVLGITLDNRGTASQLVVDVFWLGFPLNEKTKRVVTCRATKLVDTPAEGRYTISCQAGFRYSESALAYVQADFRENTLSGLLVNTWAGYGYAGWVVRVSDTKGNLIAQQGAQPSFVSNVESIPLPVLKTKKGK